MTLSCRPWLSRLAPLLLAVSSASAHAALDLQNAKSHTLQNGLTVLTLEEHSFPLVSVQMLYRTGARDEQTGRTGLAHFVEHMAFRGSEKYPDTGLVSRIYAAGGEWHGYTYLDQTTYFSTVPADKLDLLLKIEADRMSRLTISADDIPAERGAVLAEMHGYENDPGTILHDWALYTALVAHPYRNNTIGWESDVRAISRDDVVAFYRQHYQPGNAVLAIVGDLHEADVMQRVEALFGDAAGRPASPLPNTVEPPQTGERRVSLTAQTDSKQFQFVWRAPAANDPDYPAFVLLQEVLAASSGVNFGQNDWGTPAHDDALLAGIGDGIETWMMPTAQSYVFAIKGSIPAGGDEQAIEDAVADVLAGVRDRPVSDARLGKARARVQQQLSLDVQTTEDAAHQLAFFAGIDALDVLLSLPASIDALDAADLSRVARRFLQPQQRTVAWVVPGDAPAALPPGTVAADVALPAPARIDKKPAPAARVVTLESGLPVILQRSPLSPTVHLEVVAAGALTSSAGELVVDTPVDGYTAFSETAPAATLAELVERASATFVDSDPAGAPTPSMNPATRAGQLLAGLMNAPRTRVATSPSLIVLAGDFDDRRAIATLNRHFGDVTPASTQYDDASAPALADASAHIPRQLSQAHLAYVAPAPGPRDPAADAWRALLYIVSHGYEGRLGKEAISRRGLVYYIDARYRSDGRNAWITLSAGVDAAKLDDMQALLAAELERLRQAPPTADEVAEALSYRLGRAQSASQSNRELADALAEQWLWYGKLQTLDDLQQRLRAVDRDAVLDALDAFTHGATVRVSVDR